VFSFDGRGVSKHINHVAINTALTALAKREKTETSVKFYQLESVNLLRKYSGCLDLIWSMLSNFLFVKFSPIAAYRAMAVHRSQFVWYRRLFVLFSRYSYVNTYAGFKYIDL
jgi:N-acetylglucosaminylphosphatidylinositol deacetylase